MGRALTRWALPAIGAAALLAVPAYCGQFQVTLLTQGISWAVLALGVWLLLRICNLPSFGHAAFYGVGAYSAGLAVTRWHVDNVFVALGLAILISCAVALPIAIVLARLVSVSFLLVTLAFASMLHALAGRWDVLGGSDGLVGVIRPKASPLHTNLFDPANYFYFSAAVLFVALLVVILIVRSPFGAVLLGIRESEQRMAALGYNPLPYRVAAFVVSAGLAGAAGLLSAYLTSYVDPGDADALISARALLLAVIGGTSVFGPVLAAFALTELEYLLSSHTTRWLGVLGAIYVVVALVMPNGDWLAPLRRLRKRDRTAPRVAPAEGP
jgi:branched-chain amino acid transport system permease protein